MKSQGEKTVDVSSDMKENVTQFGRIAKLLGTYAKLTDDRLDDVESRLDVLEHASGK